MTLEEKVGQMFIARCPEINSVQKVKEYNLGGYILFSRDFSGKTRDEIIQNIQSYQSAAKIPMFIGVDEEGGTVNRVSTNPNLRAVPFWSPQELYAEGGFDLIQSDTQEKCELLNSLGINLNFAPICLGVNFLMLITKTTRTVNIDLWNGCLVFHEYRAVAVDIFQQMLPVQDKRFAKNLF